MTSEVAKGFLEDIAASWAEHKKGCSRVLLLCSAFLGLLLVLPQICTNVRI